MVLVGWDTSNLVALMDSAGALLCETCCDGSEPTPPDFGDGFAGVGNDCCRFLIEKDLTTVYSSLVTYSAGDWVTFEASPTGTYQSRQSGNLGHPVSDNAWWRRDSATITCGFDNWNQVAPFGGGGKTPKFYTMNWTVTWNDASSTTGSFNRLIQQPLSHVCKGRIFISDGFVDSDGNEVSASVVQHDSLNRVFIGLSAFTPGATFECNEGIAGEIKYFTSFFLTAPGTPSSNIIAGSHTPDLICGLKYVDSNPANAIAWSDFECSWTPSTS